MDTAFSLLSLNITVKEYKEYIQQIQEIKEFDFF